MQAIILAAGKGLQLTGLTENNTKCMVKINGITLIERMLKQLDMYDLKRIIIVDGYKRDNLEEFVKGLNIKTPVEFIHNAEYSDTNNIYSLYLASPDLSKDESVILDSDIIFDDDVLTALVNCAGEAVAVIDRYKSWMTGQCVLLNDKNKIVGFKKENEVDHLNIKNNFKTVGMYKFSAGFFNNFYLPFLEAYIKAMGKNGKYEQILGILGSALKVDIDTLFVNDNNWYEINNIHDVDMASTLFSDDEEEIAESMLGRWGGYWRYPGYLDYFYLVTPYYPTSALVEELKAHFEELLLQYPSGMRVNSLLAAKEFLVEPENIVPGNGAAELIKSMMHEIMGRTGFVRPTFEEYANRLTKEEHVDFWPESENFSYDADDLIGYFEGKGVNNLVIVNPDNPSGNYIDKASMKKLLEWTKEKNIKLVIDESFADFTDEKDSTLIKQEVLNEYKNLYVIKSISKSYGVPGLRLGVLASGDTETIARIKKDVSIWNINSFAEFYMQIAGKYREDYAAALEKFKCERKRFTADLSKIEDLRVIPSQSNYIMAELLNGLDSEELKRRMLIDEKIFIKTLDKKIKNGKKYLRIAIRNGEDNERFVEALKRVIKVIRT